MTPSRSTPRWKDFLFHASRSRNFLWKFALTALVAGTMVGAILSYLRPPAPSLFGERVLAHAGLTVLREDDPWQPPREPVPLVAEAFEDELADDQVRYIDVIHAMPALAPHVATAEFPRFRDALTNRFSQEEASLAIDYLAALNPRDQSAYQRLLPHLDRPEPARYARFIVAKIEAKRGDQRRAFELFTQEDASHGHPPSRYHAIAALIDAEDFETLETLREQPGYAPYFTPYLDLQIAIKLKDWRQILRAVPLNQLQLYPINVLILTLIAGLAWSLFLVHLGEIKTKSTGFLCAVGFVAGVLSTTVTLYLVVWQDQILGFSAEGDTLRQFAYQIGGVAAREELSKLLLFALLLPFLVKREDELSVCIVAAFVGLGFAIEENGGYFLRNEGAGAAGRFLSANFFHAALTGLNGLALYRVFKHGTAGFYEFLTVLPMTILAHGSYNALLSLDDTESSSYMAMIVYAGFSYYFFRQIHPLRRNLRGTLSLTGAFVFGVSIVAAASIAFLMTTLGATAGAKLIFQELIGSTAILFIFFHEFNEPLTA